MKNLQSFFNTISWGLPPLLVSFLILILVAIFLINRKGQKSKFAGHVLLFVVFAIIVGLVLYSKWANPLPFGTFVLGRITTTILGVVIIALASLHFFKNEKFKEHASKSLKRLLIVFLIIGGFLSASSNTARVMDLVANLHERHKDELRSRLEKENRALLAYEVVPYTFQDPTGDSDRFFIAAISTTKECSEKIGSAYGFNFTQPGLPKAIWSAYFAEFVSGSDSPYPSAAFLITTKQEYEKSTNLDSNTYYKGEVIDSFIYNEDTEIDFVRYELKNRKPTCNYTASW